VGCEEARARTVFVRTDVRLVERHGQSSKEPGTNAGGDCRNTGEGEQGSVGEAPSSDAAPPRSPVEEGKGTLQERRSTQERERPSRRARRGRQEGGNEILNTVVTLTNRPCRTTPTSVSDRGMAPQVLTYPGTRPAEKGEHCGHHQSTAFPPRRPRRAPRRLQRWLDNARSSLVPPGRGC
jgi:hypothetical protein